MMKIQWRLLLGLLFMGGAGLFLPKTASAFSCTSNGVSIGGAGTFTVPIDVTLDKTASNIILTDMSTYTTCGGNAGYLDALRTTSASISPLLTALGYSGFVDIQGAKFNMPIGIRCVWVDSACTPVTGAAPLRMKIGMQSIATINATGTVIPAGTEIARVSVQQRSNLGIVGGTQYWQWDKTWIFTLKSPLVVPAYACTVNNPNLTISLPAVQKADLQNNGAGRYPAETPFSLNLTCEPKTTVSVQFDGTTMSGKDDVLANTSSGNDATGIQVLFKNNPVKYGQKMQVIANALAQEQLPFTAHYYYNGADIKAGPVTSVTTFTFTYN